LLREDIPGAVTRKIDERDALVIAILEAGVLAVSDSDRTAALVDIRPYDGAELGLEHGGKLRLQVATSTGKTRRRAAYWNFHSGRPMAAEDQAAAIAGFIDAAIARACVNAAGRPK
jgi:hypothetical protein